MVLIHVKQTETIQFIHETTSKTRVGEVVQELVKIHNRIAVILHVVKMMEKMMKETKKPKTEEKEAPSTTTTTKEEEKEEEEEYLLPQQIREMIGRVSGEAKAVVSSTQAEKRIVMKNEALNETMRKIQAVVDSMETTKTTTEMREAMGIEMKGVEGII